MEEGESTPTLGGGKSFQALEISSDTNGGGRLGVCAIPHLPPLTKIVSSLLSLAASCSALDAASLCRALGCALPTMPIRRTDLFSLFSYRSSSKVFMRRGCLLICLLDLKILYISPWRCVVLFPLHTTPGSASSFLIDRLAHDTAHYELIITPGAAPSAFQPIHTPPQGANPQALLTTTLRTLLESVMDALKALKHTASLDVSRIHNLAGSHGGISQGDFFKLDGTARASVSGALGAVEGVQASLAALDEACGTGAAGGVRGRHVLASSSSSFFFSPSSPSPPFSPSSSSSSRRTLSLRQVAALAPKHVGVAQVKQRLQQQHTSTSLLVDEVDLGLARIHGELVGEGQTLDDALLVLKTGMALKRNQLGKLRLILLIAQSCILYATLNEVFHINSGWVYTFPLVPLFANDDGNTGPVATSPTATATGTFQRSSFVLSIASFYETTGVSVLGGLFIFCFFAFFIPIYLSTPPLLPLSCSFSSSQLASCSSLDYTACTSFLRREGRRHGLEFPRFYHILTMNRHIFIVLYSHPPPPSLPSSIKPDNEPNPHQTPCKSVGKDCSGEKTGV